VVTMTIVTGFVVVIVAGQCISPYEDQASLRAPVTRLGRNKAVTSVMSVTASVCRTATGDGCDGSDGGDGPLPPCSSF
jgi:hypothetical protein